MIVTGVEMCSTGWPGGESVGLLLRGLSYGKVRSALDAGRSLVVIAAPFQTIVQKDQAEKESFTV